MIIERFVIGSTCRVLSQLYAFISSHLIKIIIDYGGNTSRAETMRLILIADGMIESAQLAFDDIIIERD